jgi:hypothetical protein
LWAFLLPSLSDCQIPSCFSGRSPGARLTLKGSQIQKLH